VDVAVSDQQARAELLARIEALGGQDAMPMVPLEAFFAGNADTASIAPNVEPHPGVRTIWTALEALRGRPDVADVVMHISEILEEPEWPYANEAYVLTTADAEDLEPTVAGLGCEVFVLDLDDLPNGLAAGTPPLPPGHHVVVVFWD
jgi:hypothetical protein